MYATKRTTYQPANDQTNRPVARRVSIVMLPSKKPKPIWPCGVGFCLLASVALMGFTGWELQRPNKDEVTRLTMQEPQPSVAMFAPLPPVKTVSPIAAKIIAPAVAVIPQMQPSGITIPASVLSEPTPDPDIAVIAEHIIHSPALTVEPAVHVARNESEDSNALLMRAQDLLQAGQYRDALNLYDRVLATDKTNHDALKGKVYALAKKGAVAEAIKASKQELKFYSHDDAAEANLSRLLVGVGKYDDAIMYLDRAAREAPDNLTYRLSLATLYDHTGKHSEEALMLYKQVMDSEQQIEGFNLPLDNIQRRIAYLESLTGTTLPPSTTSPDANR